MSATKLPSTPPAGCEQGREITARLVELVEADGLSIAAAARTIGIDVDAAGMLVRLYAIELEAMDTELDDRLDEIEAICPGEDWFQYSDRQLDSIARGETVPNRIVREQVVTWCGRTGGSITGLAQKIGVDDQRLRRALGISALPPKRKGRPPHWQKTVTVECAGRIVRALGIPPCEVPGL